MPPIHDFFIEDKRTGDDLTEDILADKGYTFLLVAPHLETASESNFGDIDYIYEYAQEHHYAFYCLTASDMPAVERWKDLTGAEYPFCTTDEITLKTIIRSNPGLLLIKDGTVLRKWSHNDLPQSAANRAIGEERTGADGHHHYGRTIVEGVPVVCPASDTAGAYRQAVGVDRLD